MKTNLFLKSSFTDHKPLKSFFLSLIFLLIGVKGFAQYTQVTTLADLTTGTYLIGGDGSSAKGLMENTTISAPAIDYTAITTLGTTISSTAYTSANEFTVTVTGTTTKTITIFQASIGYVSWGRSGATANNATFFNGTAASTETWSATVDSGSLWSLANGQTSTRILQWNNSSPRFAAYTSAQVKLKLYKKTTTNYTLTYNGNGNTSGTAPSAVSNPESTSITLPTTTMTRTGFTFSGWNANSTGNGTNYNAGASYSMPAADTTLYARWAYTIAYNANGGAGAPSTQTNYNSITTAVSTTVPTRTGYTFAGWNTAANNSGTAYASGATYTPGTTGSTTLYAQWTANNNTITFNKNATDATGTMANQTIATAATANLNLNTFARAGYTFGGWATTVAGAAVYADGASYTMGTASVTLYAVWTTLDPFITTSGTLSALSTTYGTASSNTNFTVSAGNLTSALVVTPPSGFEVSLSASTGFTTSLDLGSANRTNTTIYVRLAATSPFGTYSGNISLASGSTTTNIATATSTVNKKALTITGLSGVNKEYDRTTTVTVSGTPAYNGLENGESFSVTGTVTWEFADVNTGTSKTLVRTGSYDVPSNNYTLTQPTMTASITAKPLTVTGATAQNKSYNGNTTATITGATLVGVISPDDVTVSGGGTFASANVGTGIVVTPALVLGGANATNYSITQPTGLSADITPIAPTFTTSTININTGGTYALPGANISSNSAGALSYTLGTVTPSGSVTLTGTTLNGIAAGTATLSVDQAASGNYAAGSTTVPVSVTLVTTATDYFRSKVTTGTWATAASWESSPDNTNWKTSSLVPTSSAAGIYILSGHTITIGATATAKNITVENEGSLTVSAGFTISGTTTVNGTWTQSTTTALSNSGTLIFGATGIYNHNVNGGTIPTATWNAASNCNIIGYTNTSAVTGPAGLAQTFGNLTFNNAGSSNYINLFSAAATINVNGTLTVGPASGNLVSFGNTSFSVTANVNKINVTGGALHGVGAATALFLNVATDIEIEGAGILRLATGNGTVNLTVANDVLIKDTGLLELVAGTGSTVGTQILTIGRDLIIDGTSAKIDLKPNANASGAGVVYVGRNFSSRNTDTDAIDVDFGSGSVSGNYIRITGNLTHTGNGVYQTNATSQARGFVFRGTSSSPSQISYSGVNSDYTSYEVDTSYYAELLTNLTLGSQTGPVSYFTVKGSLDFKDKSIIGNSIARFITASGATLNTSNVNGIGGTSSLGSLRSFASTNTTSANGTAQLIAGTNYVFDVDSTSPFPTGTIGNPSTLTFNNATVTSNRSGNLIVSGAVNVNGTSVFKLNPLTANNLSLGGLMTIDENATFDNNGENQITNGGGSIAINGTFITRDAQGFTGTSTSIPGITPTLGDNSTIVYGLNGDQAVTNFAYKNLTFSGSGIKTPVTIASITGTVTINSGITVDAGTRTFGGTGTNLVMLGTSIFKTGGSSTKPDAAGTYTLSPTSTIEFGGTSATVIRAAPIYGNINITSTTNGAGLSGEVTSLTLQNGSVFTVKSGGIFNVQNTNGLSGAANTAINNINSPSVVLDSGSTINYNGTAQTVTTSPNYYDLVISGSGLKTPSAALSVNDKLNVNAGTLTLNSATGSDLNLGGVMTIASGATFDNNGENQILNSNSASIINNGTFITRDAQGFSGSNAAIPAITNITMGNGSTVHYALGGNQDVSTRTDYNNILFSGSGTKTVSGNITPIAGTVTINGAATILNAADHTFGDASTNFTMTARSSFLLGGLGIKPDMGGTYSLDAGTTIEFTGTSATQIRVEPQYANVVISGTNVVAGTTPSSVLTFQSGSSFTVKNGAKFNVNNPDGFSGATVTAIKNTNNPTIILEQGSTIDYTGADQVISNVFPYENLKVSSVGTKSPAASLTVNNLITIDAGTLKILKTSDAVNANVLYAHKGINNTGGSVVFENNAQLMQDADAVNSGNIQSQRDVVDMNNISTQMDYVYWSSPVSGQLIKGATGFSPNTPASGYLQYNEINDKFVITGDTTFLPGKGYAIRAETGTNGYNKTYSFKGTPNNGSLQFQNLKFTDALHGYNLVGNPYPSNIDFSLLYALNTTKIYSAAWFWTNNSYTVGQVGSNYTGNNYATFTGTGGTPATSNPSNPFNNSITPDGTIKVGQAFIVQAKGAAPLDFDNGIRITDNGGFFQKAGTKNRFWLTLTSPNTLVNTILIGYVPGATDNFETDFDGELFTIGSDSFYSILGAKKLAIQGKSVNFKIDDKVALGNVYSQNGNYKISLRNAEGIFSNSQNIYLKDKLLNKTIKLNDADYTFQALKGTDATRFEIIYKEEIVLGTESVTKSDFAVYKDGTDYVITSSKVLGKIEVYDVAGRLVVSQKTLNKNIRLDSSELVNGIYIIKVENSGDIRTKKIVK